MAHLLVTFMEQRRSPSGEALAAPLPGVAIAREKISVPAYLALYRAVGEPVQWDDRLRLSEPELDAFLSADSTIVYLLRVNGEAAGFLEAVRHPGEEFEITHFGLVPVCQGKRLGPYLLDFALRFLWNETPRRVWLHTDGNDHPKAVATYEKAGFQVFERKWLGFPD